MQRCQITENHRQNQTVNKNYKVKQQYEQQAFTRICNKKSIYSIRNVCIKTHLETQRTVGEREALAWKMRTLMALKGYYFNLTTAQHYFGEDSDGA